MLAAASLLGALGSMFRPSAQAAATATPTGQSGDFTDALARAEAGTLASNAPIQIAKGLDLKLSQSQLSRLSGVADRAEAMGAARAIVLIDGRALTLDVGTRTITGTADMNSTQVHSDADAVITVAPEGATAPTAPLGPPSAGAAALANPSLLQLIPPTGPALPGSDNTVAR